MLLAANNPEQLAALPSGFPYAHCRWCLHFEAGANQPCCLAFPAGIPTQIWEGRHDHRVAFAGDRGIRFVELNEQDIAATIKAA